jgi:protein-arginine kinase activator protein McsA
MLCEKCRKTEATVHFTAVVSVVGGAKPKVRTPAADKPRHRDLCEKCAADLISAPKGAGDRPRTG